MATAPAFGSTPRFEFTRVIAANTNHDGTGTPATLITGATAGTKVTSITAVAEVTTTAGVWRIFSSIDGGTTFRLFDEIPVAANTVSSAAPGYRAVRSYADLVLRNATHLLAVTSEKAEAVVFHVAGADLT